MLTAAQLLAIFPTAIDAEAWAKALTDAWERFGVVTKYARANHLAILGNETGGFRETKREDMRYSAGRALQLFPRAQANPATTADRCSTVPQDKGRRFASWIYANLYGNGPEATEDGWRFRGGGPTQLTFRSAYQSAGSAIGFDLVGSPDMIGTPAIGALTAAWFIAQYKPQILQHFNSPLEGDFLAGGAMVGWTDEAATARRLAYRGQALLVVDGAEIAPPSKVIRLLFQGVKPGQDVADLQRALAARDLYHGTIDPIFGGETRRAVLQFQRSVFTKPGDIDGVVGNATRKALGIAA